MTRVLLVSPGQAFSTVDVYTGYRDAFRRAGHEVYTYDLAAYAEISGDYLHYAYQKAVRRAKAMPGSNPVPVPTDSDVLAWANAGLLQRAMRVNPDLTLFVTGLLLMPDMLEFYRRAGLPTGVILTETPYSERAERRLSELATIAWTNERTATERLNAHYLPAAYDPAKHQPSGSDGDVPAHDVLFVGSYMPERLEFLNGVNWDGIDFGLYGRWAKLGSRSKLREHIRDGVIDNTMAASLYRRAKICINLYRQPINGLPAESLNPRAVELAACGAFTLSQERSEVADVFGDLVPTFRTPAELESLIRRWLPDTNGRARIAEQLPSVVAGHAFNANVQRIVSDWQQVAGATLRTA